MGSSSRHGGGTHGGRRMEIPSIRELFTPPGTARIMKEQRIEAIDGNSWISGVIDRLLLHDRKRLHRGLQDGPCGLSGAIAERHSNQLNAYARIVSRITGIPPERIACIIVSTHLKETIRILRIFFLKDRQLSFPAFSLPFLPAFLC